MASLAILSTRTRGYSVTVYLGKDSLLGSIALCISTTLASCVCPIYTRVAANEDYKFPHPCGRALNNLLYPPGGGHQIESDIADFKVGVENKVFWVGGAQSLKAKMHKANFQRMAPFDL